MFRRINTRIILIIITCFILGYLIGSNSQKCECVNNTNNRNSKIDEEMREPVDNGKVTIESHNQKVNKFGMAEVVGEVINNTNKPVSWVKVSVTFYDENGDVLGSDYSYAGETTDVSLPVGVKAPFELNTYPDDYIPADYQLQVFWK